MQKVQARYQEMQKTSHEQEKRGKRVALPSTTYIVELYIIVDYYAYNKWVISILLKNSIVI